MLAVRCLCKILRRVPLTLPVRRVWGAILQVRRFLALCLLSYATTG
jgi:hypothetical protein